MVIDLDSKTSKEQQQLVKQHYHGSIPHVVVLDKSGATLYDQAGEVASDKISQILDKALQ